MALVADFLSTWASLLLPQIVSAQENRCWTARQFTATLLHYRSASGNTKGTSCWQATSRLVKSEPPCAKGLRVFQLYRLSSQCIRCTWSSKARSRPHQQHPLQSGFLPGLPARLPQLEAVRHSRRPAQAGPNRQTLPPG